MTSTLRVRRLVAGGFGSVRTVTGGTTGTGFPGLVDQVAVYTSALTADRVAAHRAAR